VSFRELLADFYQLEPQERITAGGRKGLLSGNALYFQMRADHMESVQMEQAVLAYYLKENGYHHTAVPIKNIKDEWFTTFHHHNYLVYQVENRKMRAESPGGSLAHFHQVGSAYGFQPQSISSYGDWKKLWTEKVNVFEELMDQRTASKNIHPLLLDTFPYIIGMSENAIQYLRETEETETRFSEVDQGTICFLRFRDQFEGEVLWPDELCYDHPSRDIAEFIRAGFLRGASDEVLYEFIRDYQAVRPLSLFSWRLIYSRLLFPAHLLDVLEAFFQTDDKDTAADELSALIKRQSDYETRLAGFYEKMGLSKEHTQLLEVDWLST